MPTEREKALEEALAQIDRQFGQDAVMKLNNKKVSNKVTKFDSEGIVIGWTLFQWDSQPWEGQVTIGHKWDEQYDHVAINVKDLSKVIAELKLQQRIARYKAAVQNHKDFSKFLPAKK